MSKLQFVIAVLHSKPLQSIYYIVYLAPGAIREKQATAHTSINYKICTENILTRCISTKKINDWINQCRKAQGTWNRI